jgi:nucleoside-diphosphate-sugar epimerase
VYGPRDREVLKVFRLVRLGLAPVFGDGTQQLSAVHAGDLAEALIAAARGSATLGRVYYPCHPEVVTSAELVRRIGEVMGRRPVVIPVPAAVGRALLGVTEAGARLARQATILTTDKANEFFQPAWTGDPAPLTRDSGWSAAHDLRSGLAETYRWYRSAGWLSGFDPSICCCSGTSGWSRWWPREGWSGCRSAGGCSWRMPSSSCSWCC